MRASVCAVMLAVSPASALSTGVVDQSRMQAQAAVMVSEGVVKGCGFRVLSQTPASASSLEVLDFSVNIYVEGFGMAKGGLFMIASPTQRSVKPIKGFWLKTEGADPIRPLNGKVLPSDSPAGYVLQGIGFDDGVKVLQAIMEGGRVMTGARPAAADVDVIHSAVVELADDQRSEVTRCFGDISRAMQRRR